MQIRTFHSRKYKHPIDVYLCLFCLLVGLIMTPNPAVFTFYMLQRVKNWWWNVWFYKVCFLQRHRFCCCIGSADPVQFDHFVFFCTIDYLELLVPPITAYMRIMLAYFSSVRSPAHCFLPIYYRPSVSKLGSSCCPPFSLSSLAKHRAAVPGWHPVPPCPDPLMARSG